MKKIKIFLQMNTINQIKFNLIDFKILSKMKKLKSK